MDPTAISGLLISVATLATWMVTQTQARNKAQRAELRARRNRALLADKYIFRLEHKLSEMDIALPDKPAGLDPEDGADW